MARDFDDGYHEGRASTHGDERSALCICESVCEQDGQNCDSDDTGVDTNVYYCASALRQSGLSYYLAAAVAPCVELEAY